MTVIEYWKYYIELQLSSSELNNWKLKNKSKTGIVFFTDTENMVGGGELIYTCAEPAIPNVATKQGSKNKIFSPKDGRIALAVGFRTAIKGLNILENMQIPDGWNIIINSSKNEYGLDDEKIILRLEKKTGNIASVCERAFLSDVRLSLLLYGADTH